MFAETLSFRLRIAWRFATILLVASAASQLCYGQESKLSVLLRRTPSTPNAMAYIHVPSLNKLMSTQNMRLEFTDNVEEAWLISQLDIQRLRPEWEAGLVTLREEIGVDALALGVDGYVDEVAGKKVVWSPQQSYLLPLSSKRLGIMRPANRSLLSKWIDSTLLGDVPAYLKTQANQPEQFLALMIAIEVKDLFSPAALSKKLQNFESTKQTDVKAIAGVLASTQGMSIIVGRKGLSECILSIEFGVAPTALQPIANQLLNEILNNNGSAAPEILAWKTTISGNTLTFRGPIAEDSLHGLVGIFSLASQAENVLEEVGTRSKLREPLSGPSAAVPQSASRSYQSSVDESKKYFDRVKGYVERVRTYKAQSTGFRAKWNQQNARRMDELPILGVDTKLVEYGADVANLLRGNAKEIRGINVAAGQQVADFQMQQGFFGDGFGMVGANNNLQTATVARATGSGFLTYQDVMIEIEKMTADIRREMTVKYNVQF